MSAKLLLAAALATVCTQAWAQNQARSASARPRANFIGEGGAYQPLGPGAGGMLETASRYQGGHGTFGPWRSPALRPVDTTLPKTPVPAPPKAFSLQAPLSRPSQAARSSPVWAPAKARAAAAQDEAPSRQTRAPQAKPESGERYSLWEGLLEPMALPAAKVEQVSASDAHDLGRQDYETHILGRRPARLSGLTPRGPDLISPEGAAHSSGARELYVALELRAGSHAYRDALAGLSQTSRFRPDSRQNPRFEQGSRTSVWGWLPADRIAEIVASPAVSQLRIEKTAAAAGPAGSSAEMIVGLRLPKAPSAPVDPAQARALLDSVGRSAGWTFKRAVGVQKIPGSSDAALVVAAEVPLRGLRSLLDHPSVIKVAPAPVASRRAESAAKPEMKSFVSYVWRKSPVLLVTTLLMLAFPFRRRLFSLAQVFVPYR